MRTPPTTDARGAAGSAAPAQAPERQDGGNRPPARELPAVLSISNWRVRQRVLALIAIPTVAATVFGGLRIYSAVTNAQGFHRVQQLAALGGQVTALAQALEDERDVTAAYAAAGRPASGLSAVRSHEATTDRYVASVRSMAGQIGSGYPSPTQVKAQAVETRIAGLANLRNVSRQGSAEPLTIVTNYSQATSDLFSLDDEIAQGSGNSQLVDTVRTLGSLSRMKDQASQQRAILNAELIAGGFAPNGQAMLDSSQAQQASELAAFQTSATLAQNQSFTDTVAGSQVDQAQNMEQRAIVLGNSGKPLDLGMSGSAAAQQWYPAMSDAINRMRTVERRMVDSIGAQSSALQRTALRAAVITGAVVLLVLLLVVLVTIAVARSMVRPLRRLQAGALDVADRQLPEAVRRLDQGDGRGGPPEIETIAVNSTDEIGEVARAFDRVHHEAVRLAADEAMLRGSVNGMFVNLSRRTQSLVERQLRLIDRLEQTEQDAERLGNLFQMDHLATRMRRNSENLLVLAGYDETSRRWTKPAPVVDVLRAAVSEIEQYERIVVDVQPGLALQGAAVSDAMHLLSEILENATSFSPADTRVNVTGRSLTSGGFLLEVIDNGVGMTADELAHENWRLDNPPMVDVSVSRRMGLFVVGRLAAKHNIRVRLRPSDAGGLTALVWIPDSLIVPLSDQAGGGQPRAAIAAPAGAGAAPATGPAAAAQPGPQPLTQPLTQPQAEPQPAMSGEALASLARQSSAPSGLPKRQPAHGRAEPPWEPDRDTAAGGGQPAPGWETSGDEPAVTPAGGIQPPWQATEDGPGADVPGESTPAAGFGLPATPGGSESAPPPGLPWRPSGAGPSAHPFGRGDDRPAMREEGAGPATGPPAEPVVVPPAVSSRGDQRSPIFDSIESEWFRSHGQDIQQPPQAPTRWEVTATTQEPASATGTETWTSPADEGWDAAEAAAEPAVGDVTASGLPRRVPQANAVPGTATTRPAASDAPVRTPEAARSRMGSFQEGVRKARAAIATEERPDE